VSDDGSSAAAGVGASTGVRPAPGGPPLVSAIVLAAGGSTRLGRPKQLLDYRGTTLLRHSVSQALASRCHPVIVVLGADEERCRQELDGLDVHVALNPDWAEGMGSSIRVGVAALDAVAPETEAVLLMLCDQPLVTGARLDELVRRFAETGPPGATVASEYGGQPGVPALFPRARFGELARLDGAGGAKRLLRGDPSAPLVTVPCPEAVVDVDTAADYEALSQSASPAPSPHKV
jgi:molybdenum cofactor cytidylyltransferase